MGKIVDGVANDYDCEQYEDWNKHLKYCQSNEPIMLTRWQDPTIEEYQKEIARLNNELKRYEEEIRNILQCDEWSDEYIDKYIKELKEEGKKDE